jgi:hypothetical protein
MTCTECNGKGFYQGLGAPEPCRACSVKTESLRKGAALVYARFQQDLIKELEKLPVVKSIRDSSTGQPSGDLNQALSRACSATKALSDTMAGISVPDPGPSVIDTRQLKDEIEECVYEWCLKNAITRRDAPLGLVAAISHRIDDFLSNMGEDDENEVDEDADDSWGPAWATATVYQPPHGTEIWMGCTDAVQIGDVVGMTHDAPNKVGRLGPDWPAPVGTITHIGPNNLVIVRFDHKIQAGAMVTSEKLESPLELKVRK